MARICARTREGARFVIKDLAILQRSELFSTLVEEELAHLAPICSDFVVIEDAILFAEGRNASRLYLVTEGKIALQKSIRAPNARYSRRTTIAFCGPGEVVGWSALVYPYRYTLSAVAWESSRLISVDPKLLKKALDMYPVMGYKVMSCLSAVVSRRLKQTTDALVSERTASFYGLNT